MTEDEQLLEDIAGFEHDPHGYVHYMFPWGEEGTELHSSPGPRTWQDETLKDISEHLGNPETRFDPLLISIASGHSIGKAQRFDSIIPTPNGHREIIDIEPGDFVFGRNGKPVKVLKKSVWEDRPCYRVSFDDRTSVVVDENHLWPVIGRQERRKKLGTYRVLSTKEILDFGIKRPNGRSVTNQWHLPKNDAVYGKKSEPWAYALGVWIGDGSAGSPNYTKPDNEVFEKVLSLGIKAKRNKRFDCVSMSSMRQMLKDLDLFSCRSYERFIPDEVWSWDSDSRFQLLSGLLDTDGECNKTGSIIYSTSSEQLLDGVIRLCRSLGFKTHKQGVKKAYLNGVRHRDCYRLTVNIPKHQNPFSIKRKGERLRDFSARFDHRWIDKIEPVENAQTVCITVDAKDGLYLANDYILTHNSALIAQIMSWGLSTCVDTKVVVTANTEKQLLTKTMPEVAKWFRLALNSKWWKPTATAVFSTDRKHEKTWRADAIPWSKHNTESFAGLHNKDKRLIILFDEASAIDDKIYEVTEGALTDENTEIIWICFGNPTRNTGRFRECFRKYKHLWKHRQIDASKVEGINQKQIQSQIETYGWDSDFVKVRVRGMFPAKSFKQFISSKDVDAAYGRDINESSYDFAPIIITLDNAWEGDDEGVFALRQGNYFEILDTFEKNDNDLEVASALARFEDEHNADAVFIDAGYGTGVFSAGKTLKRDWKLVWFAGKAGDKGCINKRAEMWTNARDWLKEGGSIPEDPTLQDELTGPEQVSRGDGKTQIESKKDMKARGLASPNRADALILSFAYPVTKKKKQKKVENLSYSAGSNGWMG